MKCKQLLNEHGRRMQNWELKKALGMRSEEKYTPDLSFERWVGNTKLVMLSSAAAVERAGHDNRPHRLRAQCNECGKLIPAGRMGQHYRAH